MFNSTFEQRLVLRKFSFIVKLSKIFRLLGEVFPLHDGVSLMGDNLFGSGIKLGYRVREIDACTDQLTVGQNDDPRFEPTTPHCNGFLKLVVVPILGRDLCRRVGTACRVQFALKGFRSHEIHLHRPNPPAGIHLCLIISGVACFCWTIASE